MIPYSRPTLSDLKTLSQSKLGIPVPSPSEMVPWSAKWFFKKMEIIQHSKYTYVFCRKEALKRECVGIWHCKGNQRSGPILAVLIHSLQRLRLLQRMRKDYRWRSMGCQHHSRCNNRKCCTTSDSIWAP